MTLSQTTSAHTITAIATSAPDTVGRGVVTAGGSRAAAAAVAGTDVAGRGVQGSSRSAKVSDTMRMGGAPGLAPPLRRLGSTRWRPNLALVWPRGGRMRNPGRSTGSTKRLEPGREADEPARWAAAGGACAGSSVAWG